MTLKLTACLAASLLVAAAAQAVTSGQTDTFEDGTTGNWTVGAIHPAPPQNVPDGGPAGAGDNYLFLTALGGNGPGSRLAMINAGQWAGDYLAAGVVRISMNVANFGATDLSLRLVFMDPVAGPPTNVAITAAVPLLAGSGWQTAEFAVAPGDLIVLQGDAVALLGATTELRLFHGEASLYPGPPVVASLGVDNIMALTGEVPAAATSLGALKAFYR
jgi:hypothetical protein